jgi:hypothetical protein
MMLLPNMGSKGMRCTGESRTGHLLSLPVYDGSLMLPVCASTYAHSNDNAFRSYQADLRVPYFEAKSL